MSAHVSSETKEERGCLGWASNRIIVRSFVTRTGWNPMGWDGMRWDWDGMAPRSLVLSFIGNLKTPGKGENNQRVASQGEDTM